MPVLLPLSGTDHNFKVTGQSNASSNTSNSDFDKVAMGNVRVSALKLETGK